MAKLSDLNQNPALDSLESLKRRYQRQNRELAKANANQAQQIQVLQSEIAHQNAENIRLGSEIIHLQRQLDVRDSRTSLGVSDGTKRLLEEKLLELSELVRGLGDGGNSGSKRRLSGKRFPTAVKPEPRERPDGLLQDIPENGAVGRTAVSPLFPTTNPSESRLESPSKNYIPLDSAMFDIRPRRRRDSANVENLIIEPRISVSEPEDQPNGFTKEASKRKYPTEEIDDRIPPPRLSDLEDVFSSPMTGHREMEPESQAEGVKEYKDSDADIPSKKNNPSAPSPVEVEIAPVPRSLCSSRKSFDNIQERAQSQIQAPLVTALTETRRILEPKSTNIVTLNNSPVKLPTAADFEYVKKDKISPKDREPAKKSSKIIAKPIIVQGAENTMTPEKTVERNRRTRGVTVNYALPALNKKMRRETETLVDAVTGIQQPKRRSVANTEDSSAAPTPAATPLEGERKILKTNLEDLERRTSKMSIHHDGQLESELVEKKATAERSGMSERDIRKRMAERTSRDREARLEETRKDIYAFTSSSSPDATELGGRRSSGDKHSLTGSAISGSHQRRTSVSNGIATIGIGSGVRKEGEIRASSSTSSSANLKSASDLLEERRRRRATLGGSTSSSASSSLSADTKSRKSVGFADSVTERERTSSSSSRDTRRRSMVV
ncbi:hypothetical protein H072_9240 [Dactylellina haptotyla CBS 200.50]|uniref:Shugoshin C-terminal domain-containing protein n=1 Tax=Dactylellina haptotyla (strain CBS 200.50) TaxID=1284197 RepID=S8BPJ4_DACHA|nr:hypothetical protein H072_9240 [Dactylellina haptotyla CBS 200.50]